MVAKANMDESRRKLLKNLFFLENAVIVKVPSTHSDHDYISKYSSIDEVIYYMLGYTICKLINDIVCEKCSSKLLANEGDQVPSSLLNHK